MLGARVLTVEEGTYKYGKGEGKKLPREDGLELEILLETHEIFIYTSLCIHACVPVYCTYACICIYVCVCVTERAKKKKYPSSNEYI